MTNGMAKPLFRWLRILMLIFALISAALLIVSFSVWSIGASKILLPTDAAALQDVDCILVLGCQVKQNGTPSVMLADRVNRGIELYFSGTAPKLLMSGDHGRVDYDEVGAMKQLAIESGVPSADVFLDHAGFSTYESLIRAKQIFGVERLVIVTQNYHLPRALYIADQLGMEAYGVASDFHTYGNRLWRESREFFARIKDFAYVLFQPAPTYLGDPISLGGSGDVTNG